MERQPRVRSGTKRGHLEPFNVKYFETGNKDNFNLTYNDRCLAFYDGSEPKHYHHQNWYSILEVQ